MSKFEQKKVMPRFFLVAVLLALLGVVVVVKAAYIMTAEKDYWDKVAEQVINKSVDLKCNRGNILSSNGQLMASSIPEYKAFMDFQAGDPADTLWTKTRDSLWTANIDSLCIGLNRLFPERSAAEFKVKLEEGRHKVMANGTVGARHWPVWPRRIDYHTYCAMKELPLFNLPTNKGGFHTEQYASRRRPFGSLAQRTVGIMYSAKDTAYCGIELTYDSLLRGHKGLAHSQKVRNKMMQITQTPPIDGADIVTTIDVDMQDLAERAVVDELKEIGGDMGVAILMEVKTGDVKAIVNMTRCEDGEYHEVMNNAIGYRCEPGSVFKVASFLVALDDGVVDTSYVIHTGGGVENMHGRWMKDHNWRRGGYGDINVARTLEVSSNIGVSHVIDHFYGSNPKRYVEGLYRVGIGKDLGLSLQGYRKPWIRFPDTKTTDRGRYWSKTTLPWMSIGYETQIAPINTVTFYNGIANGGKMMRPRFVKRIEKDGQVLLETQPKVLIERMAKSSSIATMQTILEHVVSQGLGKKAGSLSFKVAGKTGTAQIADEHGSYHSGTTRYWLSFAGYFPADDPRYTCLVCLRKTGLPASGGGMSGVVFHNISEGVMAQYMKLSIEDAREEDSSPVPDVKSGNLLAADYVLAHLGVKTRGGWSGSYADGNPVWGRAEKLHREVAFSKINTRGGLMPDVKGMGARDAVYLLEQCGLRVRLNGKGRVKSQSIVSGQTIRRGMTCQLELG